MCYTIDDYREELAYETMSLEDRLKRINYIYDIEDELVLKEGYILSEIEDGTIDSEDDAMLGEFEIEIDGQTLSICLADPEEFTRLWRKIYWEQNHTAQDEEEFYLLECDVI